MSQIFQKFQVIHRGVLRSEPVTRNNRGNR